MMGKDRIKSVDETIAVSALSSDEPSSNRWRKVRLDTGKRHVASTIVHFRQLFQECGMMAFSLGITGKNGHTALMWGEAGSGGVFPFLPCLYGNMEEGHFFENQETSTFVTFVPRHRMPGRPETDTHSVMSNDEKVLRSPLNLLTLKEGMP